MGITFGDHLIDSGYYDITPEQEREREEQQLAQTREDWARQECKRRGIDPNEVVSDGGVEARMVVAQEAMPVCPHDCYRPGDCDGSCTHPEPKGWTDGVRGEIAYALTKRLVIDMPTARAAVDEALNRVALIEVERLANLLDPEVGLPSDYLLRCIHADIEMRGRKNSDFAVSVHHRNIVLSAVANALRSAV